MPQISTIKPVDVTKPKVKPQFTFNDDAYQSYIQEGFEVPTCPWTDKKKKKKKKMKRGKIKVQIRTMIRQIAIDYSTENEEEKEYLTWVSDWSAKNYQEVQIFLRGHIEGYHIQQTKELATQYNHETGETRAEYRMGAPSFVFNIPFTPKKVEEILHGEHPLGPHSVNITKPNKVIFYGKFDGFRGIPTFRCSDYTYKQFVSPKSTDFAELAIRPGGPASRIPIKQKPSFIT